MEEVEEACETVGVEDPTLGYGHPVVSVYPNPCEGAARLRYQINDKRYLISNLYSISGQKIKRLLHEVKPAGTYELEIDMGNLPAGVYFCTFQTGDGMQTTKIIKL